MLGWHLHDPFIIQVWFTCKVMTRRFSIFKSRFLEFVFRKIVSKFIVFKMKENFSILFVKKWIQNELKNQDKFSPNPFRLVELKQFRRIFQNEPHWRVSKFHQSPEMKKTWLVTSSIRNLNCFVRPVAWLHPVLKISSKYFTSFGKVSERTMRL